MTETVVVSYLYRNRFDISRSPHRIARVSKRSNKDSSAIKLINFSDLKTHQRFILLEEMNNSKKEPSSLVESLRENIKNLHKMSKCFRISLPKTENEIRSTKSNDKFFAHYCKDVIEHPIKKNCIIPISNNISCVFSINIFEPQSNQITLTEITTLTITIFTISARRDITLQTSVK